MLSAHRNLAKLFLLIVIFLFTGCSSGEKIQTEVSDEEYLEMLKMLKGDAED